MNDADQFGLEAYLYEHIPVSEHLGVRVDRATMDSVRLAAPLEPNLNHRRTGFGGSICALAILAAWSLLWCRLRERTGGHNIVIQSSAVDFAAPVTTDFTAECLTPSPVQWDRFRRTLEQRGRSRIQLEVSVRAGDILAATFKGRFVVLSSSQAT